MGDKQEPKKHKWLSIVVSIVGLIILVSAGQEPSNNQPESNDEQAAEPEI